MGARVLVVDDDPWILRMVTATLQKRQYVVDTAREGRQAIDRVRANIPDIIITDLMMPVMDGWTFIQQLRQDPRLAAIPVIFLTALGKDQARLQALGLTDKDYLSKPFRFEELERRVGDALSSMPQGSSPSAPPGYGGGQTLGPPMHAAHGTNPNSGVHPMPTAPPNSGTYPVPPAPTPNSGVYPMPAPPPGYPMPGPSHNSGVHPMPTPGNPYAYPPQYPPGQYPPPQYPPPQYPPQYPPGQYPPPQYPAGQYPPQYPPPGPPQAPPPAAPPDQALDADTARRGTALNGKLEQLGLSSLLVMMEMERKQGVLNLTEQRTNATGRVWLRGGQVVAADLEDEPDLEGRECVYRMLAWKAGAFSFSATKVDVEDTVQSSTTHLLMEGARLIDEADRGYEGL